jgi:hypothetical protein
MKDLRIIYTEDHALALGDERGKQGYNYNYGMRIIDWLDHDYSEGSFECGFCINIVAHRPLTEHTPRLGNIPLLPELPTIDACFSEDEMYGFLDRFNESNPISYIRSEFTKYVQRMMNKKRPKLFSADMAKGYVINSDGEPVGFPVHDTGEFKIVNGVLCGEYSFS